MSVSTRVCVVWLFLARGQLVWGSSLSRGRCRPLVAAVRQKKSTSGANTRASFDSPSRAVFSLSPSFSIPQRHFLGGETVSSRTLVPEHARVCSGQPIGVSVSVLPAAVSRLEAISRAQGLAGCFLRSALQRRVKQIARLYIFRSSQRPVPHR